MSLDLYKLPLPLIPDLYGNCLIQINTENIQIYTENIQKVKSSETSYNLLGKNLKNILIFVNDSTAVHLNDADFQFLTSILNACKLSMNDVGLLNLHQISGEDFNKIDKYYSPQKIILFGINEDILKFPFFSEMYEVVMHKNTQFLQAPSLQYVAENADEKKKLWASLKKMFGI